MHDPGKIITDLAVALALGGDCLADIALLHAEPELFGPVAFDPVVSRLVTRLAADAPRALRALRGSPAASLTCLTAAEASSGLDSGPDLVGFRRGVAQA